MTEAAPVLRLHAVMLGVRDLEASVGFYTEKLGIPLHGRFENFAFFELAGGMLVLSAQLARARPPAGPEPVELVLAVDEVQSAFQRFRARGVTFLNEPHPIDGTNYVANFEDPDQHLLSLYGAP
jgi:catechol 2,3-dioxygenase-like lactoylglutathione lyase family enzyme